MIAQCRRTLAEHERGFVEEEEFGETRRFVWRDRAVAGRLRFLADCPHPAGRWKAENRKLEIEPWQLFFVSEVYGWVDEDDPRVRRIREAILFVPRKNGKTTLCAPLGLHEAGWGDAGAEVYVCATKKEQAQILWDHAKTMVAGAPKLSSRFKVTGEGIFSKRGKMVALSSQPLRQDGMNPSLVLADEAAAITDANQIHVLESGMGARDAPLSILISTAQPIRNTLFYTRLEIARRGLETSEIAVSSFAMIYELDAPEERDDPENWIKANPNLNVSVTRRSIGAALRKAEANPRELGLTLCKTFNIWSQRETAWLSVDKWDACAGEVRREGPCYIGLDLAENRDLAAACALWDHGAGRRSADWQFWTPKASLDLYPPDDRRLLEEAADAGLLILLDEPFVDIAPVKAWVLAVWKTQDLRRCGTDPWHAKQLTAELEEAGVPILQVAQSQAMLSDPIKSVENMVLGARLAHGGHPLLSWMVMNAVAVAGMRGGVQLAKPVGEPHRKIDGIDALVTAQACVEFSAGALAVSDLDLEPEREGAAPEYDEADLLYA